MKKFALALLLLSSCAAQIEHKMKTVMLLSPESQGGWPRIEMGAGLMSAPIVSITDDARLRSPDRARSLVLQESKIFLHGGVGVLERLDLSLDPASWLNAKYQFIGDPFTRSEKGNVAVSVLVSGWTEKDEDNDGDLSFSPTVNYTKKSTSWRAGLIGGYRFLPDLLAYAGLSHQEHRYSGNYSLAAGTAGRYAGRSIAQVATLGGEVSFNKRFLIRVEDAYSIVKVPAHGARSSQHSFGFIFAGLLGEPAEAAAE
jgi:hypothetical protein